MQDHAESGACSPMWSTATRISHVIPSCALPLVERGQVRNRAARAGGAREGGGCAEARPQEGGQEGQEGCKALPSCCRCESHRLTCPVQSFCLVCGNSACPTKIWSDGYWAAAEIMILQARRQARRPLQAKIPGSKRRGMLLQKVPAQAQRQRQPAVRWHPTQRMTALSWLLCCRCCCRAEAQTNAATAPAATQDRPLIRPSHLQQKLEHRPHLCCSPQAALMWKPRQQSSGRGCAALWSSAVGQARAPRCGMAPCRMQGACQRRSQACTAQPSRPAAWQRRCSGACTAVLQLRSSCRACCARSSGCACICRHAWYCSHIVMLHTKRDVR